MTSTFRSIEQELLSRLIVASAEVEERAYIAFGPPPPCMRYAPTMEMARGDAGMSTWTVGVKLEAIPGTILRPFAPKD